MISFLYFTVIVSFSVLAALGIVRLTWWYPSLHQSPQERELRKLAGQYAREIKAIMKAKRKGCFYAPREYGTYRSGTVEYDWESISIDHARGKFWIYIHQTNRPSVDAIARFSELIELGLLDDVKSYVHQEDSKVTEALAKLNKRSNNVENLGLPYYGDTPCEKQFPGERV